MFRIILLSYHFFNATAEGLVTAKLAKALADRGHSVVVVTSCLNPFEGRQVLPAAGPLAGIAIHRAGRDTASIPWWWRELDRRAAQSRFWDKVKAIPNLAHGCGADEWAWVESATRRVLSLWETEGPFDVLHTRLNHYISHLAGLQIVKRLPGLAWCAYFSDPWPPHLYPEPYRTVTGPLARYRYERLLQTILSKAGSSIFPADRLRDHVLRGARYRFRRQAFVAAHLTNLGNNRRPPDDDGLLTIRHSGFLMRERRIEPLYEGLRRFLTSHPDAGPQIRVEFAGRYQGNVLPEAPTDLRAIVQFHPHMAPETAWDWLQGADVLLLVEAKMKEGIFFPSKLADYLGAGRPILALSPREGVTGDYLRPGGGIVVDPDDADGIAGALAQLHDHWKLSHLSRLQPTTQQVRSVSPELVIPVYERAFESAIAGARARLPGS